MQSFVLMGLESAGKSTLFNILTESAASDERNFRDRPLYVGKVSLMMQDSRLIRRIRFPIIRFNGIRKCRKIYPV